MADDPKDRRFVSVRELARIKKFHEQTIYEQIKRGAIPGVRYYGRSIRIDLDLHDQVLALNARRKLLKRQNDE